MSETLFPMPASDGRPLRKDPPPRVQRPNRRQVELRPVDLEGLLPVDHRARIVWEFVEQVDLTPLYAAIRAVEGEPGRPPIDPAILMALWLYATLEGVGSARAVARLCEEHDAYRWLCGGVTVNYHTLADFRVAPTVDLDGLLTQSVAALTVDGLVPLTRIAQDGLKVRAAAGRGSFRRAERLREAWQVAAAQVAALRHEVDEEPGATTRRQAAARARGAAERQRRVAQALAQLPALEAQAQQRAKKGGKGAPRGPIRVSTTDADARTMKMADGGYRPAFNAQFATDTASQIIVGVAVTTAGTDVGQLAPMMDQLRTRYGRTPRDVLADGGYVALADIRTLQHPDRGCRVYAPAAGHRDPQRAGQPRWRRDDPLVAEWRQRMATPEAQAVYRQRAAVSECVNALARNRGLQRLLVRGVRKVRAVLLWFALAHNLLRAVSLRRLAPALT
jgi:transposase/IS5 family transposase